MRTLLINLEMDFQSEISHFQYSKLVANAVQFPVLMFVRVWEAYLTDNCLFIIFVTCVEN